MTKTLVCYYDRPDGNAIRLIVPLGTLERLATTCFRGRMKNLAGNFKIWASASELLDDPMIAKELLAEIESMRKDGEVDGTFSITIVCDRPIGWSSTAKIASQVSPSAVEKRNLNRHASALFVKESTGIQAPLTDQVTFVCTAQLEDRETLIIVRSIYPGDDVGELTGDMTARTGHVWFAWTHPGV
jgi:hypothetical protein